MRGFVRCLKPMICSAALAATLFTAGCTVHAGVASGYGYRTDYHTWNDHETVYYNQWEVNTHRNHMEFDKRSGDDQKAYWKWRHHHN